MSIFDWITILGVLVVVGFLAVAVVRPVPALMLSLYRHARYTCRGVCYQCGHKFVGFTAGPVDKRNIFSDKVLMPVCTCKGATYLPVRHYA